MVRCYSDLIQIPNFDDRYEYLRLSGRVAQSTFGFERFLNQRFYTSLEWKKIRRLVIVRDNACDLAVSGHELNSQIVIHHMNPVSAEDFESRNPAILNPEFLICVSHTTHEAIHFGDKSKTQKLLIKRVPGDTTPWA